MKFTAVIMTLTAAVLALPNAAPVSKPDAEPGSLMARACSYTTGCVSMSSSSSLWTGAGKYCGFCDQVLGNWVGGDIYQYERAFLITTTLVIYFVTMLTCALIE